MREFLNENTLFAEVMMQRSSHQLLLVVEGPYDVQALQEHVSEDIMLIYRPGGKQVVLRAARMAYEANFDEARFLVDRDYDDVRNLKDHHLDNVVVSDGHDSFVDLVMADKDQLLRVIQVLSVSLSHENRIDNKPNPDPDTVFETAVKLACQIAAVRIVDARHHLGLNFNKFKYKDTKLGDIRPELVARRVLAHERHGESKRDEIVAEANETYESLIKQPRPLVGDHDLFEALAYVMRQYRVDKKPTAYQQAFILRVGCSAVMSTGWFSKIQTWSAAYQRLGFTCH